MCWLCCSFAEKAVAGHFIILAMLWLGRDPQVFPGWSDLLGAETKKYLYIS